MLSTGITKKQKTILILCLLLVNFVYFISSAYITNSNDGSHFALVSSLVENGSVEISDYIQYTDYVDYAKKGGEYFSDRVPGTAILAIPFFSFGVLLEKIGFAQVFHIYDNIKEVTVLFLPNLAGTLLVYLVFLFSFHYCRRFKLSLATAVLFAFTTLTWFESTHLFSHIISATTAFAAFYLLITMPLVEKKYIWRILGVGALLGLSSIIEIQNILFVPGFFIYLLVSKKLSLSFWRKKGSGGVVGLALLVFLAVYAILPLYNFATFGELTIKSNKYNPQFPEEQTFAESLSGNIWLGLDSLFINSQDTRVIYDWGYGIRHKTPGLLIISPLLIMSLIGLYYFFRRQPQEAALLLYIILVAVIIVALHKTVLVRHVYTITPFLFAPIIFVFEKFIDKYDWQSKLFYLVISIFTLYSLARIFYVMNSHWARAIVDPFPFVYELPTFIIFCAVIFVLFLLVSYLLKKYKIISN